MDQVFFTHSRVHLVVLMGTLGLLAASCSSVSFVERIVIVNQTDYPASVKISDASRKGWLDLAFAEEDAETSVQDVIDQGEVWVFRFEHEGVHEEEIAVPRSELSQANWNVEVPQKFEAALRELGIEPPP